MSLAPDALTPAETAVVSGVSIRDVHRVIDEKILPTKFYDTAETRSIKTRACVFISFYFGSADRLTSEERQRTILRASLLPSGKKSSAIIQDGFLSIDLSAFQNDVEQRLHKLQTARSMVLSDPEVLGGTPVIRGTRVPVYDIAANVAAGIPTERILSSYPSLSLEQVELSAVYARANPLRGRPRQHSLPAGARVLTRKVISRKRPSEAAH